MSDIKKKNGTGGTLLVWVTNPGAADRIVACGKRFAEDKRLELKVVSVQSEARDNWEKTLEDLRQLDEAASRSDAELKVVYSDDKLGAAMEIVRAEKPVAMFSGVPDKGSANYFADQLTAAFPSSLFYCVDSKGEVIRYER
jgi:K+-sensing histidine kinase KdpD